MNVYDYLIVGAGSAGCVLANRLSADLRNSVMLLEAGGGNRHPLLHVPAGWAANFNNPKVDWGYSTAPEPGLDNREIYWPRGKVLGGSSAINGMVYVRGVPLDFEIWAQAGARGWSFDEVLPYFRKAEVQQRNADTTFHGHDGPLHVQDVRDKRSVHEAFIDAWVEMGVPRNADFNGVNQAGTGYYQFTQKDGRRWSTATAYLDPVRSRRNLTIMTRAFTQQILFDGRRAIGVQVRRPDGSVQDVHARHVILSGGAINSPQLLELSGVGDGKRLQTLGIEVVHDLPGVGENLQDHLYCSVVYGTHDEHSINREVRGLNVAVAAMKWLLFRDGPLTTGSAPVGAFWYTRDGLEAPDIQVHFASGATIYNRQGRIRALDRPAMSAVVNQSRPQSRGSLHIQSAVAAEPPLIQANYLASEVDRQTIVAGMKMLMGVFQQAALAPYITDRITPEQLEMSDADILAHVRSAASSAYHPVGTCSMGEGQNAVVTPELHVRGVSGLSVVDASVMPTVVSGNTNAATIMVAEKAAEIILGEQSSGRQPAAEEAVS